MGVSGVGVASVILLAAGRGERVGEPKGLVMVQGVPWLERQLERLAECGLPRVVVVLGHAFDAHATAMAWVTSALARPVPLLGVEVEVARNDEPDRGPFSSLTCGIARLGEGRDAYVLPVDVPCPGRATWEALSAALVPPVLAAVPVRDARGGHPVLLSAALVARLHALPLEGPEARLDVQLRSLAPREITRVPVHDVRAFTNLNTPEDWEGLG
jgi:CTP:molybdopterin cytidylyltransferase MocA